jgi:hypothetical protein
MNTSSKRSAILKTISWRGLLKWVLVAFFVFAGLLNVFATASLLEEYRRWGYPGWFHYATGLIELSSAVFQALRMANKAGLALGMAVMAAAVLTLAIQREWLHALFPLVVLFLLITSRITNLP